MEIVTILQYITAFRVIKLWDIKVKLIYAHGY